MKKLLIMGMLALGLSVAAPTTHAEVSVGVHARVPLIHHHVGVSVGVGRPYYYRRSYGTVVINRRDRWRHREWMRRRRLARIEIGR